MEKVVCNNYSFFPLIKLTLVIVSAILFPHSPPPDTYYFKLIFFPLCINIFLLRNSHNRLHKTCKVSIRWLCKNGFYLLHIWQLFLHIISNFQTYIFPLCIKIFLLRNSQNRLHKTCMVSIRWLCKNGFYLLHIWQLFLRWYSNCFKQTCDSTVVGSKYTTGRVSILHYYDSPVLEVFPQ